jgi:hypothetical protein
VVSLAAVVDEEELEVIQLASSAATACTRAMKAGRTSSSL